MTKSRRNLRVVSLFAGCGGADVGILGGFRFGNRNYGRLSTRIVHASDIDAKAVRTYNANFPHLSEATDIRDLSLEGIAADLVVGGFPCQSFSTVNPTKDPNDDRGQLYLQMARIIKEVRPRAFIAENVKGFMVLGKGRHFNRAIDAFERSGYTVNFMLINSADFGVPQLRQRVFIVGIRSDLKQVFEFPKSTHSAAGKGRMKPWKPLRDILLNEDEIPEKYYFSKRAVQGVDKAKNNMKRALAQDVNHPSLTITSHLAKASLNSRDPVLLPDPVRRLYRRFTPREAARIQSFPDKFVFPGSDADAYRQIGNAIPPVLMWHLVRQLIGILK